MLVMQRLLALMLAFVLPAASIPAPAQDAKAQRPASPSAAAPATPAKVLLKADTEVPLKFGQSLHSRLSKPGTTIELALAEDLKVGDAVVVRKGARALGSVIRTNNPNSRGKGGELYLRLEFLKGGGRLIKLRGEGGGKEGRDICWTCGVGGLLLLGAAGYFVAVLGSGGKQYVIKEGTPITAYVAEDIELPVLTQ
jgi:hypothetical protein